VPFGNAIIRPREPVATDTVWTLRRITDELG